LAAAFGALTPPGAAAFASLTAGGVVGRGVSLREQASPTNPTASTAATMAIRIFDAINPSPLTVLDDTITDMSADAAQ